MGFLYTFVPETFEKLILKLSIQVVSQKNASSCYTQNVSRKAAGFFTQAIEPNFYIQKAVFIAAQPISAPTTGQSISAPYPALKNVNRMQYLTLVNSGTLAIVLTPKTEDPTRAHNPLFHISSWPHFSIYGSHRFSFQNISRTPEWFPFQTLQIFLRPRKIGTVTKTTPLTLQFYFLKPTPNKTRTSIQVYIWLSPLNEFTEISTQFYSEINPGE